MQTPDVRERPEFRERPDLKERYFLASFHRSQCAVPLSLIDRVVREPNIQAWEGNGVVQGYVLVEGWLVWLLEPAEVFSDLPRRPRQGDWLMVLKEEKGLSRLGVLADDVRGPVAFARIDHARILQRRRGEALDEFR